MNGARPRRGNLAGHSTTGRSGRDPAANGGGTDSTRCSNGPWRSLGSRAGADSFGTPGKPAPAGRQCAGSGPGRAESVGSAIASDDSRCNWLSCPWRMSASRRATGILPPSRCGRRAANRREMERLPDVSTRGGRAGALLHAVRASTGGEVISACIWGGRGRARKDRVEGVQLLVAEQSQINPLFHVDCLERPSVAAIQ
jgi:hypothetical protein